MGHPGDVIVGQVNSTQSAVVRESLRRQFGDEVLLQSSVNKWYGDDQMKKKISLLIYGPR